MLDRMLLASPSDEKLYVEDVMSSYLYTGNGSTGQTIANGIDLAGKGGMVWIKSRSVAANHWIVDTARGSTKGINSNTTNGQYTSAAGTDVASFLSNGFSLGADNQEQVNTSGATFASWTFRKAPKFFDVVTYTGNGNGSTDTPAPFGRGIPHSLGVKPGFVVIKRTDAAGDWWVAAQKSGSSEWYGSSNNSTPFTLNSTNASGFPYNGTSQVYATDTAFYPAWIAAGGGTELNINGATYVAYLFAHDATADGIIQCGSYTGNGTTNTITLGWEPQWLLVKRSSGADSWQLVDNMRGWPVGSSGNRFLYPNLSDAEYTGATQFIAPTATGFQLLNASSAFNQSGETYIYIAIRRGPMKTPTVGTSVFSPYATASSTNPAVVNAGFPIDLSIARIRTSLDGFRFVDRLRGITGTMTNELGSYSTSAEASNTNITNAAQNTVNLNYGSGYSLVDYNFRRAPGFFDVVCYTGTGADRTVNHNLGVAPELIIIKNRSATWGWDVEAFFTPTGYSRGALNTTSQFYPQTYPDTITAQPTSTQFAVSSNVYVGASGNNYVAYLFASCPGVSKVGSYTGNGSSQTINCGFSSGARFFLVKRTDSTGDWWVYDSARGIVAAADPALRLNSTAAEVTSADAVDTDSTGIIVNQEATCNINVNGATYIYLSVA